MQECLTADLRAYDNPFDTSNWLDQIDSGLGELERAYYNDRSVFLVRPLRYHEEDIGRHLANALW